MKKIKLFLFLFFILIFFTSCKNILSSKKPNLYYYTNDLSMNLAISQVEEARVLEINFMKDKIIEDEDIEIISKFITTIKKEGYINKPSDLPTKSEYKIFITFKNEVKYIIEIYNSKYASIYPFDGNYPMDYIDMTNTYKRYNLQGLCNYLFPKI